MEVLGLNNLKDTADFGKFFAKHENIHKFKYHQSLKNALLTLPKDDVLSLKDDDYRT